MMLPRIVFLALLTVALAYGATQETPELEILTTSLPDAILNRPYRVKLEASGGQGSVQVSNRTRDAVAEVPLKNAIYRSRREHRFLQVE